MQRALIHAAEHASPGQYSGFLLATDDAVLLPWNMGNLNPDKFWVSPLHLRQPGVQFWLPVMTHDWNPRRKRN